MKISVSHFAGYVTIDIAHPAETHLTADEACELAADLLAHANALRKLSDEDKIRDAMAEAQEHPGRVVTIQ